MCNSKQTNERSSGKGCISPYFVNCKHASTKKEERTPWFQAKNTNYYCLTKKEKQTNQEHQNQTESFGSGRQMTRTEILSWDKAWTPEWSNILIQKRSHSGKKKKKRNPCRWSYHCKEHRSFKNHLKPPGNAMWEMEKSTLVVVSEKNAALGNLVI